jgi:galactonate dehydratase
MSSIVKLEYFLVPPRWLFVRIEDSDGAVGWGEASLEGHCEAVGGALESLRDRLIGHDADRIEDAWQIGYRGGFYRGGAVLMSALSGVDQALWDLKGKRLNVPVWQLLGGQVRDRVSVYAWIGGDRPADVAAAAAQRKEQGFKAVKMNASEDMSWIESSAAIDAIVQRVELVRAAGIEVAVDFHGRIHKPMARQIIRALEPVRPLFIEEPLLSEHFEGIRQLANSTVLPIALGERLYSRADFKQFLSSGSLDVIQPDLSHAGGISECKRIAALAEMHDVALAPHCPLGPLAFASCMQLALTCSNFFIQEMSLGIHYNNPDCDLLTYVTNPDTFTVTDGTVAAFSGTGLGVNIDESRVREAAKNPHRWRNPLWRGPDGALREW